jgi:hypothetical protein
MDSFCVSVQYSESFSGSETLLVRVRQSGAVRLTRCVISRSWLAVSM